MDSKELRGLVEAYAEVYAPQEEIEEATYSAKAARAGKDIGKPGKAFAKIAKEAGKRYGSKERGEKVAGAVLAKLRKQHEEVEIDEAVKGADPEMRKAAAAERRAGDKPLSKKVGDANAAHMARKIRFSDKVTKAKGHIPGYTYAEDVDIFDIVLEFLQAEGYAETLEEAEWMMVNELDSEDIDAIVIGEADSLAAFQARREKRRAAMKKKTGYEGHDYSKPHAQAAAEREQRMRDFLDKK